MSLLELMKAPRVVPPWGSKGLVNRAGDALRAGKPLSVEELHAVEAWRAAHKHVLNSFQATLRNRTKGTKAQVAQRLKRRHTIIDKLSREKGMQLSRMDDIAGCRLIFPDISAIRKFRNSFLRAKFNHKHKNEIDKYDYIKRPKDTGYRGIHDIYQYNAKSKEGQPFAGLLIELQYRTFPQHAWATAVELVSRITDSQPKFLRGDKRYIEFFRLASEIIARAEEDTFSIYPDKKVSDLVKEFTDAEAEVKILGMLHGLHTIYEELSEGGTMILQFSANGQLKIHQLDGDQNETAEYFRLEKENPEDDIVLVNADTFEEIRSAYRNYFSDSQEFLRYAHDGTIRLGGKSLL
jgi:ppGpp synthetase/RelA/SpoT-type nucleotidyltranferase